MISALNLLFGGVPSNAVSDLIKFAFGKATTRSWDELYSDAFDQAFEEERPRLTKYGDAEIAFDRVALNKALHQDPAASVSGKTLSELTDAQFVYALADALAEQQVLTIGGNNLSDEGYRQIAANLVRHAMALFIDTVTTNQAAFQQAMIDQSMHDAALLAETQRYLEQHFELTFQALSLLPDIKADTEAIKRKLEINAAAMGSAPRLSRSERLSEMARESRARCIERWWVVGLSLDEAIALADDPNVGAPKPEHQPNPQRPLLVLVAELGTGKSLLAEHLFQSAINLATSTSDAPVPVFLKARECIGRLRQAVLVQAEGLGDVRRQGAAVVVDGVDEAGDGADELLRECRILVTLWSHTTIVVTSRPLPAFAPDLCKGERVDVRPLSEEEATALIQRLTGKEHFRLFGWPTSIRDAVRLPLFAILLSLHLRNPHDLAPQSTGDLLAYLVERALGRTTADGSASNVLLQQLAVLSTDRAGAFVSSNEFATRDHIQQLLASRLVVERHGAVGFPLAILREWFAAYSLASGVPTPVDLVRDRTRLQLWRYPLIMFVSMFGYAQVFTVLEKLAERHPGYTSDVVSEALSGWHISGEAGLYNPREWGLWIRAAMKAWVQGIGPLASCIAPVTENGRLRPLSIYGHGDVLTMSWYHGTEDLPDIVDSWPSDQDSRPFDWPVVASTHPVQRSVWAWRWTRDSLRSNLTRLLRENALPMDDGPLLAERFWQISQAIAGRSSLWADPIPVQKAERFLQSIGENETVSLRGSITLRPSDVAWYGKQVACLRSSGMTVIEAPYPGPDLSGPSKGWIWDNYSDEQLLKRTVKVLGAAIEGYGQLVETWFQAFAPELATAALLPARLVGTLIPPPREDAERWKGPSLDWYWLPLDRSERSGIDIQLGTSLPDSWKSFEVIRNHIGQFRSQAASWLPVSIEHREASIILTPNPATKLIYEWLRNDLKRVSWVD